MDAQNGQYYFKKYSCPLCGKEINALRVKSRYFKIKERFPDFGAVYEDNFSPYLYEILVCPFCGFSWNADSEEYLMPAPRQRLEKALANWQPTDLNAEPRTVESAITAYKRAILCDQVRGARYSMLARKEVHLAWLYRGLGDKENELRFMTSARDHYRQAFGTEDLWSEQNGTELLATYMTAVLSHLIGDDDTCKRWLSRVIFNHPEAELRPSVVNMAKELWQDIRNADWRSTISEIEALAKEEEAKNRSPLH